MSDVDDVERSGEESSAEGARSSSRKKGLALAALLPNLLKFVAIGLGALVFIVTVTFFAVSIFTKGGKSQTAVAESASPYVGTRPQYQIFSSINTIRTRTKDATPYSVVVDMVIGYDMNDRNAQAELTGRLYELQDFVRRYFSGKYASELQPENEVRLKQEILNEINTRILDSSTVKIILFRQLDVMEM